MILEFYYSGKYYEVNEQGEIKANGLKDHSKNWIFLGGSSHHWHRQITVSLKEAFKNPSRLNGCLGWDIDHGTVRQWRSGTYGGKLERIKYARIRK